MALERRTDPDTLQALADDIRVIKNDLKGEIADLTGMVMRIDGKVCRLEGALGFPAEPGKFEGDPPKPATGLCATIDRIAKEQARRTRLSVLSAGGVAAILTALAQLIIATHAWSAPPEKAPTHQEPK